MASNSETGHAINLANEKTMYDYLVQLGVVYAPSNPQITTAKINANWTAATAAHKIVNDSLIDSKKPINDREILFDPMDKLVTRMVNNFGASGASDAAVKDAKGFADDIRGFKVRIKKDKGNNPLPGQVSVSQLSFVNRQDNFSKLVSLLKKDGHYNPSEPDLKVLVLEAYAANLKTLNDNIGTILAPLTSARGTRDQLMYEGPNNLLELARLVKKYCKGLPPEYAAIVKVINGLRFKKIKP